MFLRSPICSEQGPRACGFLASKFPGHSGFFRLRLCRANERVASGLAVVDLHRLVNTETAHRTRSGCGASRIIAAPTATKVRTSSIEPPSGHGARAGYRMGTKHDRQPARLPQRPCTCDTLDERTLVMVMVNGFGANLANEEIESPFD